METIVEKRTCERHACDLPVVWCYFNQKQFHRATILNYSEYGVCLATSSAPNSGATILIKRHYPTAGECSGKVYEGHREITLAEVRWCCDTEDTFGATYRVGASYLSVGFP